MGNLPLWYKSSEKQQEPYLNLFFNGIWVHVFIYFMTSFPAKTDLYQLLH